MKTGSSLTPSMSLRLSKHADDDDLESEGIPLRRQESLRTPWYSYILCFHLCHSYKHQTLGGTDINLYLDPIILMVILFTGNGREDDIFVLLVPCFGFTKRFLDFSYCIFYTVSPWCIQKGLPNVILSLLVVYCILPTDDVSLASFCRESVDIFPKLWTEFSEILMKANL